MQVARMNNIPFDVRRSFDTSHDFPPAAMGDDDMAGEVLRMLTGCEDKVRSMEDEKPPPDGSVSWTELEMSCQKLDEAHIRIESLDLSNIDDEDEGNAAHNVGVSVEPDTAPSPPPPTCLAPILAPSRGHTSAAAAFLAHSHHNRSFQSRGSEFPGRGPASGPLCPVGGSPSWDHTTPLGANRASGSPGNRRTAPPYGGSLTNSPSVCASSAKVRLHGSPSMTSYTSGAQGKLPNALTALSPSLDPHSRSSRLHHSNNTGGVSFTGLADPGGPHHMSPMADVAGAPRSVSAKAAAAAAPGRALSGAWKAQSVGGTPGAGSPAQAGAQGAHSRSGEQMPRVLSTSAASHAGPASAGQAARSSVNPDPVAAFEAKAQMSVAKLAQEGEKLIQQEWRREREPERDSAAPRYTSLLLPGAVPRDQAKRGGVRGYLQTVKSKCGVLFTSSKK